MKKRIVNITVRVVAAALLISLCALPVAIAPRDARAAFGDCIAYDTFNRDDGDLDHTETSGPSAESCPERDWVGDTWDVSGNKAMDAPTLGDEDVTNGSMETGDPPSSWNITSSSVTLDGIADERTGGGGVQSISVANTGNGWGMANQNLHNSSGTWVQAASWGKKVTATNSTLAIQKNDYSATLQSVSVSSSTWSSGFLFTTRLVGASCKIILYAGDNTINHDSQYDDVSVKPLTLSTLFTTVDTDRVSGTYSVEATLTAKTNAGLAILLNSQSNPTAGIVLYHDGSKLIVDKFTAADTWVNLISTTASYAAGRVIKADITTTAGHVYLKAYYNNVQIGTEQDITDAAIIDNTYHGIFSTYSGNSLNNFYISDNIPNTATPTNTATNTHTNTPTASDTPTNTPTDTATNTPTASDTPTNTSTHTATFTNTFTITYTPTFTDTPTETYTPTETNTSTASKTPTNTFTPTNTATLHYDATTTYEAAYAYYTGIAEQNYPIIIILSVLCGIILLALIVWGVFAYLRRRR